MERQQQNSHDLKLEHRLVVDERMYNVWIFLHTDRCLLAYVCDAEMRQCRWFFLLSCFFFQYAFTRLLARSIEIELNLKDCFNLVRYFCQLLLIRLILNVFFELVLYLGSYFVAFAKSLLFTALCSASFMLSFAVIRLMFFRPCFSLYSCCLLFHTENVAKWRKKNILHSLLFFFPFIHRTHFCVTITKRMLDMHKVYRWCFCRHCHARCWCCHHPVPDKRWFVWQNGDRSPFNSKNRQKKERKTKQNEMKGKKRSNTNMDRITQYYI